jgi:hypothetical protein
MLECFGIRARRTIVGILLFNRLFSSLKLLDRMSFIGTAGQVPMPLE